MYPWDVVGLSGERTIKISDFAEDEKINLTRSSMMLANNQINEACNKLYATVELANAARKRTYSGEEGIASDFFSGEFILGALVPVLYYCQVAALLSLLSTYGILFLRDRREKEQRRKDQVLKNLKWMSEHEFLIIRMQKDWRVTSRSQECKSDGWHIQLVSIGRRFLASGVDCSGFDFELIEELKTQRERADYRVLGGTSMESVGFQKYLELLPRAHSNIRYCISAIRRVTRITNNCDTRLTNLEKTELANLLRKNA
jgi:hypothetical protein